MNALHQQGSERERLHVHGGCDRGGLTQVYELMGTLHEMSEDDSVSTGVQGVTPGYMRELLDLRNIRDECEEWKRKAAQQEKENEALRIQCAQAKEEQRSSGQQLEEIQHRFNELQLLHPSTAMAIEAAEQRLYAKSVLEMSELQGQHEIEAAALHDANEALRQVVTRLCSPNSDFEGGPTSSEAPYFPDLTAVSHTSPPHILHLADCPGARWANQGHGCSYSGAAGCYCIAA